MSKFPTPTTFVPKNKRPAKKRVEEDFENTREDLLDDDSSALEINTDEDEPTYTQSFAPPAKKSKRRDEVDVSSNDFSLDEPAPAERSISEPISIGSNYEILYYSGDLSYLKNSVTIKRTYVDAKGVEKSYPINIPKQNLWGLTAGLMRLMSEDAEVMAVGKNNAKAMARFKYYFKAVSAAASHR